MRYIFLIAILLLVLIPNVQGQGELAATLEVITGTVAVQRVNTTNWVSVNVEAIVGVGDLIRTDATGSARIIFFSDGTETELLPNTEYRIDNFAGDEDSFNISVTVLTGQTVQRLNRLLDNDSSYDVQTPAMELVARGTEFRIRVEASGRAAMLVDEGTVASENEAETASVEPGFGLRADETTGLSDVVAATSFEALDAALDGCTATLETADDVSINVRSGPSTELERLGTVDASEISTLFGTVAGTGWYRIELEDGSFGWILSSNASIGDCAGLREFPLDYVEGADPGATVEPAATPEATAEPGQ